MQISAIFCRKWSSSSSGEFKLKSLLTKELRIVLVYIPGFYLRKNVFSETEKCFDWKIAPDTKTSTPNKGYGSSATCIGYWNISNMYRILEHPHHVPDTGTSPTCIGYWNIHNMYQILEHPQHVPDTGTSTTCTGYWNIHNMYRILEHPQHIPDTVTSTTCTGSLNFHNMYRILEHPQHVHQDTETYTPSSGYCKTYTVYRIL